jgi:putative Holliday junction resolvase
LGRVAGIDFGTVRIGLAISDEQRIIARPLETIRASSDLAQSARLVAHALLNQNIETIVIGLPLLLSGKEGDMAKMVRSFAQILGEYLPIPIVFWDERLTSLGVDRMLLEMDVSRKKRAELSDALSAVSILQNYLDSRARSHDS